MGKSDGRESGSWGRHSVLVPEPELPLAFPAVMPVFDIDKRCIFCV